MLARQGKRYRCGQFNISRYRGSGRRVFMLSVGQSSRMAMAFWESAIAYLCRKPGAIRKRR